MSYWGSRPEQSTSAEAALLTQLSNLAVSGSGFAIAKTAGGFANVAVNGSGGSGTVTSVSVASANGLGGSVATATTTPAITLTTSVTGVLYGNGTGVAAATGGQLPSMSATVGGAVPTPPNNTTTFLRGDGTFAVPAGSGTVNSGTAGQMAWYASSTTAVSGNANANISNGALTLGVAASVIGQLLLANTSSGVTTLSPGATAAGTLTLPAGTDTLIGKATTDILTNKTYDTAGTGNVFKINGTQYTSVTGTGAVLVAATSPTLVTPVLGVATATSINSLTISTSTGTLTITNGKTVSHTSTTTFGGTDGKTVAFNNSITFAGTDSTTMTFPAASDTVAGLGTAQTFTAVNIFTPGARASGTAAYFTITTPADTGQTAATESIGIKTVTGTRTWATTGTVGLQREVYLAGVTYASAGASQTFTDITTLYVDKPVAGTNAIFTRAHSVTIVDSTSAASSVTGGFVIATTLGTTATSVGIGGGNINAGGTLIVGGHVTFEGVTSTGATGTNLLVFATSPTLTTPVLGVASATTINKVTLTTPASGSTLTIADGKTLTASVTMTLQGGDASVLSIAASKTATISNTITFAGTDSTTMTFPSSSATVAGLGITQTFTGINTFTPAARSSGSASYFTINAPADTGITTTAESIGINHVGATRTWADGTTATQREYLFQAPTYNKTTTSATFTKAATLAVSAAPTAGTGVTITNAYAFWVQAGMAQFDGQLTTTNAIYPNNAVAASGNAATVPVTSRLTTVTNNSAATLTVTITTSGAVDGQLVMVRILDFSAVAQTITWVNTENSTATAPVTSNGSTSLPITAGFQYNSATSKWRCLASA